MIDRKLMWRPTKSVMYGFPVAVIDPGQDCPVTIDVASGFRGRKLLLNGQWDVVRGYYKIKRSRLPLLDRERVNAFTEVSRGRRGTKRWFKRGRTTVMFLGDGETRWFVRSYLPENVIYVPSEPLHLIMLKQIFLGTDAQMAMAASGAFFGAEMLGNGLLMPTTTNAQKMSLLLSNIGDVQIKVYASVMGTQP
jgi:hypothetical protein